MPFYAGADINVFAQTTTSRRRLHLQDRNIDTVQLHLAVRIAVGQ
jgi:hypothetical protein